MGRSLMDAFRKGMFKQTEAGCLGGGKRGEGMSSVSSCTASSTPPDQHQAHSALSVRLILSQIGFYF